jgi:transcriptional regulator with XRE-family HTH domain
MYELAKQQMTSKELEERTKLSESTIYNAKLGRMIKLETAQRIADALNVSLNFLLTPMVEVA